MTFCQGGRAGGSEGPLHSSLEGNTRRAIDFREGEKLNEKALKDLARAPWPSTNQRPSC